jgi:hypothetical protein
MQPVSSCDPFAIHPNGLPKYNPWNPSDGANAPAIFVDAIDNRASMYDPPAMPQDVHELVQLFTTRPEIW